MEFPGVHISLTLGSVCVDQGQSPGWGESIKLHCSHQEEIITVKRVAHDSKAPTSAEEKNVESLYVSVGGVTAQLL